MSNNNLTPEPEFDLFAPPEDDHLAEQLAKGTFQWTNKTTKILAVVLLFVATLSGGAWYGHHTATTSASTALGNFASLRGSFRAGGLTAGTASTGSAIGGGAAGASGFGGFSRGTAGTVTSINGKSVTITFSQDPTTPLAKGDNVTVRASAGGFGGSAAAGASTSQIPTPTSTSASGSTKKSGTTTKSSTIPSGAPSTGGRGFGGGGGGFNNPAFTACLAKAGVTLAPGTRPDRTDPKVAAALQSCFSTLGIQRPGGAGGAGNNGGGMPLPSPAPSN